MKLTPEIDAELRGCAEMVLRPLIELVIDGDTEYRVISTEYASLVLGSNLFGKLLADPLRRLGPKKCGGNAFYWWNVLDYLHEKKRQSYLAEVS